jgi:hypothetical protein
VDDGTVRPPLRYIDSIWCIRNIYMYTHGR